MVSFEQVVARIGQLPVGDAPAMRSLAARLSAEADGIFHRAQAVTHAVQAAQYQSPAADRLRAGTASTELRLQAAATRLFALAAALQRGASQVEEAQHFWHTEFARVESALRRSLH